MFSLTKFYVLIALMNRPLHIYAIYRQIPFDSGHSFFVSYPGVRNAVATLLEAGYIETAHSVMLYQHPRQGATYKVNHAGIRRLKSELTNYRLAIAAASIRLGQLPPWLT
ncbi:MAG TPA: hypothetical protein VMR98_02465 [Candidatus Polarisedimenticolaceae bacterium]|nr:hypothetical protein [Candidatus Polarisedimenticolaceae bacterium]